MGLFTLSFYAQEVFTDLLCLFHKLEFVCVWRVELDGQDAEQTVSHYALKGGKLKQNAFKKLYTRSRRERSLTIPLFPSELKKLKSTTIFQ